MGFNAGFMSEKP